MTQQCKYDEQLLDYLYGELDEPSRRLFAEHLQGCSACTAQVESLGQVRKEYKNRPPIEPAGESMQRMTALLMQAAAAEHAPAGGRDSEAVGGGKVLQFRSRGLRRILFHPASGVMAVAATALFWVVFRAQPGAHTGISGPTSFRTAEVVGELPETPAPAALMPMEAPAAPGKSAPVTGTDTTGMIADNTKESQVRREGLAAEGKGGSGDELGKALKDLKVQKNQNSAADKLAEKQEDGQAKPDKADNDEDFNGLRAKARSAPAKELSLDALRGTPTEEKPQPAEKQRSVTLQPSAKPTPAYNAPTLAKPSGGTALDLRTPVGGPVAAGKSAPPVSYDPAPVAPKRAPPAKPTFSDDQVSAKAEKKAADAESERWAQPPPPPVSAPAPVQAAPATPPAAAPAPEPAHDEDNSVRGAIARTRDQRQQKVVEALASQELGSLGAGGNSNQAGDGRYAQRHASPKSDTAATGSRPLAAEPGEGDASQALAQNQAPGGAGRVSGSGKDDAAALTAVKDQIRRGQCADAAAALAKLERAQPTLHGLAETRAEWQSACAAPLAPQLERRLPSESFEAPAPASVNRSVSKLKVASPSPAPPKAPARAKAAKPVDRKAADALQ